MRYQVPDVGDNNVIYKGKRYWVIELCGTQEIDGFGKDFCQYLMYDKLYNGILATINKSADGKYSASLMSHVELCYVFDSMKNLIQETPGYADKYYKACGM